MSLVRFGAATFSGSAIWCTAIALVGYELGGEWNKITKGFSAAGYVLVGVAVVDHRRLRPPTGSCGRAPRARGRPPLGRRPTAPPPRRAPANCSAAEAGAGQPFGQWEVEACAELGLTSRHDSSTATKSFAGICFIMSTSVIGHWGKALPWKYQSLPLSASIRP
jgi:hypothetical protein